ncbi:MAG TPA: hypothetical protein VLH38_00410 [Patescibacteria group bacterium]|nr:hypothetical protein [Patescibacteria group bacterium]
MTNLAAGAETRFGDGLLADVFRDRMPDLNGYHGDRTCAALVDEEFGPILDKLGPLTDIDAFHEDLASLDDQFGAVARRDGAGPRYGELATKLVDRIEDRILDTNVLPRAFSSGAIAPFVEISFVGIEALPGYIADRSKISPAGMERILGQHGRRADIASGHLASWGNSEAADRLQDRSRSAAKKEGAERDALLRSQVAHLAGRFAEEMVDTVRTGDQYGGSLRRLAQKAVVSAAYEEANPRPLGAGFVAMGTARRDSDPHAVNVVARTREQFLEAVFMGIQLVEGHY